MLHSADIVSSPIWAVALSQCRPRTSNIGDATDTRPMFTFSRVCWGASVNSPVSSTPIGPVPQWHCYKSQSLALFTEVRPPITDCLASSVLFYVICWGSCALDRNTILDYASTRSCTFPKDWLGECNDYGIMEESIHRSWKRQLLHWFEELQKQSSYSIQENDNQYIFYDTIRCLQLYFVSLTYYLSVCVRLDISGGCEA